MAADDEFVTIVPVGEARPAPAPAPERDPAFVTVLTVGAAAGAAEVLVRRPRGARLGLGLKFEGGSAAAEKVRRLLVQSCATDSPAANASTPWGKLIPGDEILAIDGHPVSDLTRIDCVRRLKESDESLKLLVRHLEGENETAVTTVAKPQELQRPTCLPPPVPPRKLNKKNSFKDRLTPLGDQIAKIPEGHTQITDNGGVQVNNRASDAIVSNKLSRKSSFDSHIHRQAKESFAALAKSSPEVVRRLVRRLSDGKAIPPEAEVYMDLISQEWERCLAIADAESDDTGSSISTVVDRFGSMTSSVENSIPSTPTMPQKTIDIQKVLNCIENIDSDLLKDIATTRFVDKHIENTEIRGGSRDLMRGVDDVDSSFSLDDMKKKIITNDKNNNNTIVRNVTCINIDSSKSRPNYDKPKPKIESAIVKPRPLPRSTRPEPTLFVEKQTAEAKVEVVDEPLLTPTKKTCIESWLQRSEAELIAKISMEETPPEALPRLIDFVPKPQFRDMSALSPKLEVEAAEVNVETRIDPRTESRAEKRVELPTPPPESREDGSGASLDTIGELDEGTDTANTEESAESEKREPSCKKYESSFWEGRANRSDADDNKSLSNDETPTPTFPRQPPDGVETPCDAVEKSADSVRSEVPPPLPTSSPSNLRLSARLPPPSWPTGRERVRTSYSRSQDARSECSVKDKIAMFSAEKATSVERVDRCGLQLPARPAPNRNHVLAHKENYSEIQSLDRRLTKSQDNLDEVPKVERAYRHVDKRPEVLGAHNPTKTILDSTDRVKSRYSDLGTSPMHYGSTNNLASSNHCSESVYHARSISDDSNSAAYKSTLEYLIEQRKKSMTKLRGLMIPEVQGPIVDLPEIKVQECNAAKNLFNNRYVNQSNNETNTKKSVVKKPLNLADSLKINIIPNHIPKYSPAFKRKSLQVYSTSSSISKESTPERKLESPLDMRLSYPMNYCTTKSIPTKPPRNSIETKKAYDGNSSTLPSRISLSSALKLNGKTNKTLHDTYREYGNIEVTVCTATDIVDSDNDSAVSSTQSSYRSSASSPLNHMDSVESDSSHLSPRSAHYISYSLVKTEEPKTKDAPKPASGYEKRNVCRSISSDTNASISSSTDSAATSGSQASCSSLESSVADSGKKKVTRTHSVDTINRRNILASAKCRSGRDLNVGSPVVETKFTHESPDRSPSPETKTSDRLTTLALSVSGLSSKGEVRRTRSKVIADTDSDSESEVNVRQRKNEFKSSRLKKNTNLQATTRQTEQPKKKVDCTVADNILAADDVPQMISQRIIKEIQKAGLHDIIPDTIEKTPPAKTDVILPKQNLSMKSTEKLYANGVVMTETIVLADKSKPDKINTKVIDQTVQIEEVIESIPVKRDVLREKTHNSYKVCLKRGVGAGVGLILAGGIDCEAKAITVHKVLAGSVAEREGLQRGARVLSINGRAMEGLTHAQTVAILKEPRSEVSIEIESSEAGGGAAGAELSDAADSRATNGTASSSKTGAGEGGASPGLVQVVVEKSGAGAGLGFGLEGGKDSPQGDRPLTIKKLFAGGAAARSGRVLVGAELVAAGERELRGLTRTQAWATLKELPAGPVALLLRNPR